MSNPTQAGLVLYHIPLTSMGSEELVAVISNRERLARLEVAKAEWIAVASEWRVRALKAEVRALRAERRWKAALALSVLVVTALAGWVAGGGAK